MTSANEFAHDQLDSTEELSLQQPFTDDDKIIEDIVYPDITDWHGFFKSSISKIFVAMMGFSGSSSLHDSASFSNVDAIHHDIVHATPAQKLQKGTKYVEDGNTYLHSALTKFFVFSNMQESI